MILRSPIHTSLAMNSVCSSETSHFLSDLALHLQNRGNNTYRADLRITERIYMALLNTQKLLLSNVNIIDSKVMR